jgi:ABC-2 type transport system ATP-binding protein
MTVEAGECFGLLGPNGAGKTTTIEILEGLAEATSGEVEIFGMRWGHDDTAIRERIGVSLQETKLPEKLQVGETVTLFRSFYRNGPAPEEVLRRVSLEEKIGARVGKLSGGQRQRLAVACALVGEPDLLLLDEPTTGLDPQSRRQLWDLISGFRARGKTVLLTTHYMDEAERLCDRVAVVDHGKVIALGSPRELIAELGGEHVVEFTLETPEGGSAPKPSAFDGVRSVRSTRLDAEHYSLSVAEPHLALPALLDRLEEKGLVLSSLTTRHASLEDVFVTLTGRHLRDGDSPS